MKKRVIRSKAAKTAPVIAADGETELVDLSGFPELTLMKGFFDKFFGPGLPTPLDCLDVISTSRLKAEALLESFGDAQERMSDRGDGVNGFQAWPIDPIKVELEMMCVAGHRLYEIHARSARKAQADAGRKQPS